MDMWWNDKAENKSSWRAQETSSGKFRIERKYPDNSKWFTQDFLLMNDELIWKGDYPNIPFMFERYKTEFDTRCEALEVMAKIIKELQNDEARNDRNLQEPVFEDLDEVINHIQQNCN